MNCGGVTASEIDARPGPGNFSSGEVKTNDPSAFDAQSLAVAELGCLTGKELCRSDAATAECGHFAGLIREPARLFRIGEDIALDQPLPFGPDAGRRPARGPGKVSSTEKGDIHQPVAEIWSRSRNDESE